MSDDRTDRTGPPPTDPPPPGPAAADHWYRPDTDAPGSDDPTAQLPRTTDRPDADPVPGAHSGGPGAADPVADAGAGAGRATSADAPVGSGAGAAADPADGLGAPPPGAGGATGFGPSTSADDGSGPGRGPAAGTGTGSGPAADAGSGGEAWAGAGAAGGPGGGPSAGTGGPGPLFRHGLVRPVRGRYLTGVCAGLGRVTGTDPILWRIVLSVLGLFGVGILLYLILWLISPAEGDTGSPVDALLGRGRSSTPNGVTVAVAVGTVIAFGVTIGNGGALVLAAAVLIAIALLANRATGTGPTVLSRIGLGPEPGTSFFGPVPAGSPATPPRPPAPAPAPPATPAYTAPFAPHGPWGGPPAPPAPPPAPRPAKRPRERSPLGLITISVALLALGALGVLDLADVRAIEGGTYVATALGVTGLGLLAGAWIGRARALIPLGLVLLIALGGASAAHHWDREVGTAAIVWAPRTVAEVQPAYERRFGEGTLDLSRVNFAGTTTAVNATAEVAHLRIVVPPTVNVTTSSRVQAGRVSVFGFDQRTGWDTTATRTDQGTGGTAGGTLELNLTARAGNVEVTR
ncbi:hypothetical protein GCM10010123_11050 [Pilimelia anulata]|uniref:Phage shock protein PspC N-terminal domain-containing protein n=1 Tax=Pilimelia anulata TaxID=53371 RepID=A0A8J3B479_9ACTN|nr:PspC domain-containing protein [Pilimelia anulata]GGJ83217.1 hypothetical protein GCM10010123_11050 [Pilimelia anulata]